MPADINDETLILGEEDEYDEFTLEFLSQLETDKNWALDFYSARNDEFERMEKWYFKEHYAPEAEVASDEVVDENIDETEHLTILPIPTNIVNTVHGMITDEDPYIQALSATGRKSIEASTKTERFCSGTYWINRQVSGVDAWELSMMDALIFGWACVYSYWDPSKAKLAKKLSSGRGNKDILDFYSYPITVRRIHPRDIYPLPYGVREKWRGILWIVNRTVREVEEEWNVVINGTAMLDEEGSHLTDEDGNLMYEQVGPETYVEYVDYWVWRRSEDGDFKLWHCVTANGQVVKEPTSMDEYEMLPYEVYFCRQTPSDSGSRMGLSFLYPIIEPVQEMEFLANRMSRMVEQYADPIMVVTDQAGSPDQDIEKGPGTIIYTNAGGDAKYLTWTGSPPDVQQMLRLWRDISQDAFPPIMTGAQGGSSGLDTLAQQQGGKLQTNKPRRNMELAMQRVNTKIIRLLQRFSMDTAVNVVGQRPEGDENMPFAISIKGKETRGFENTIVTVRGRFPQEELRNVVVAAQAVGAGLMSKRTASGKYLFVQDPEKENRLWMEEQFITNPAWQQFFFQMYTSLPTRSPVQEALEGPPPGLEEGESLANDLAGAEIANAIGVPNSQVQKTPVVENIFSKFAGGAPSAG
jgi:hypothetical protein